MEGLICKKNPVSFDSTVMMGAPGHVEVKTLAYHHCSDRPWIQIVSWNALCMRHLFAGLIIRDFYEYCGFLFSFSLSVKSALGGNTKRTKQQHRTY